MGYMLFCHSVFLTLSSDLFLHHLSQRAYRFRQGTEAERSLSESYPVFENIEREADRREESPVG